uniref:Tetratricopeptide repeat protein n=1 Tax=Oscillatoriales cyanobacterium SpSt-402 TaxID=2282168 RepID=A0A832H1R1_9CYAN
MKSEFNRSWRDWIKFGVLTAIATAAFLGVIALQRSRLREPSLWLEDPVQASEQEKFRLELLKQTPSFGFDNLFADWVFLNFLQYYGDDDARDKTGYALSPEYFDIVTRRDPRFAGAYIFLSNSVSHQAGRPELAVEMMQRGADALSPQIDPLAFQVWRFMSLDQLLLLGDIPGARRSLEMAAQWVEDTPYAELNAVFRQTAEFLRKDPNSKPVRVSAWAAIYQQAAMVGDQQTQERAKREIFRLGGKIFEKDGKLVVQPPPSIPAK